MVLADNGFVALLLAAGLAVDLVGLLAVQYSRLPSDTALPPDQRTGVPSLALPGIVLALQHLHLQALAGQHFLQGLDPSVELIEPLLLLVPQGRLQFSEVADDFLEILGEEQCWVNLDQSDTQFLFLETLKVVV